MRILGAMLGGTIASYDSSGTIKLGKTSFVRECLTESFPEHVFVFPGLETYSSENAGPETYIRALKEIVSLIRGSDFDGVIITHGTDTCAFFAQLSARILPAYGIPFIITGSVRAPDADPAEAAGNLRFAVKMIEEGRSGAVFRDRCGEERLYDALLITSPDISGIYDEYGDGDPEKAAVCRDITGLKDLPEILVIPAVPGAVIPETGFDRVLICCNHSGTASEELVPAVEKWTAQGIKCYMAPVPRNGGVYESRRRLREAGAVELPGMPVEGAWTEVLLR